ncbi:TIGR01627 family protein [Thermoactinomyces sp. DSM 45891]|uniref:hypothetical protein n=1 Tax=Thermoactinomyces sp. DSM 45891 TaxID=1761907 RepID=UPI00091BD69A|nr:hypothetical protein [Thermoactinomyces sp. DSM 45891]SFX54666.1 TIGR01627 family protein [Thermoactinomyces sp. DSM 45891]
MQEDKHLLDKIRRLVEINPGQLSVEEYLTVAKIIKMRKPCNILIFGVGKDSQLWSELNKNGKTVFIEDNPIFFNRIKEEIPNIEVELVKYGTKRNQYMELLNDHKKLEMDLPKEILTKKWDIIFVDAPVGYSDETPGRMQSIYMASWLASQSYNTHVIVHDCDREVEKVYCDTFFAEKHFLSNVMKLRLYLVV